MKTLQLFAAFAFLHIFKCANVPTDANDSTNTIGFQNVPFEIIHKIVDYVKYPSNLRATCKHLNDIIGKYPMKRHLKYHLNIPELTFDYIAENEPELEYLRPYLKFAKNPYHLYQALKHEFLNGKFDKLLINLASYFERYLYDKFHLKCFRFTDLDNEVIEHLVKRQKFDFFFQNDASRLTRYALRIFNTDRKLKNLQNYLLKHPTHFEHVVSFLNSEADKIPKKGYVDKWNLIALVNNMPDEILIGFPHNFSFILDLRSFIWTQIFILKDNYYRIFDRINLIIDQIADRKSRELYRLVKLVRFGPESAVINVQDIQRVATSNQEKVLFVKCASLAGRDELFKQLLNVYEPILIENPELLNPLGCPNYAAFPIELSKVLFDAYQYSGLEFRKTINCGTDFLKALYHSYRIESLDLVNGIANINFIAPEELIQAGFPERIHLSRKLIKKIDRNSKKSIEKVSKEMTFDNDRAMENFILKLSEMRQKSGYRINGKNLKIIVGSDRLCQLLREYLAKFSDAEPLFKVNLTAILEILDEPRPCMSNILKIDLIDTDELPKIKTFEQLARIEVFTGMLISEFNDDDDWSDEYFTYRHVYKYLIDSGQEIPDNVLDDNRDFLRIDFPSNGF